MASKNAKAKKSAAPPPATALEGWTKVSLQNLQIMNGGLMVSNEYITRSAKLIARATTQAAPPASAPKKGAAVGAAT